MLLYELFDNPASLKVTTTTDTDFIMSATLSDSTSLQMRFHRLNRDTWNFTFKRFTPKNGFMSKVRGAVGMQPALDNGTYKKTGQGSEIEVFSTVRSAVEQFYDKYDPSTLMFSADKTDEDGQRANLYRTLTRRMFPKNDFNIYTEDHGHIEVFVITRKDSYAP